MIDVGSAEGYFSLYMAKNGANVIGLELDNIRVQKSELIAQALDEPKVKFYSRDLSSKGWINEFGVFDYAFCYAVLHRVTDPINLIDSLFRVSDTVIFEWEAPKSFISDRLSVAIHPTSGNLDVRNLGVNKSCGSVEHKGSLSKRRPYYLLSTGFVKNVAAECGACYFIVIPISEKYKLLRFVLAVLRFFNDLLFTRKPFSWSLTQRVIVVASKKPLPNIDLKVPVYASWDGSLK